ncbi:hypothetical protein A3A48_04070 [Candidatus Curtissbacteria bacterium RIFCSPLOWO2_01_FULL_37_9]|uniref:Glycosyltransferase RgtA/B/C/D-like domain-containing protein n=1 Tax=Candidatus Curtissbacteria bacterium RIFCSPLOWO2_01_FULL_37_9 TaxID=1797724 RepID=A0A1F5GVC5_9BACT|nr:MAG: hypothetical protein A3A48_04070 [Candidatus Curtissbacteria bacterium RIFCSPLOWO2_01_FULL_37_9]
MIKLERYLLIINFFLYFCLLLFSYSYVDLNLTVSQNPQVLFFINMMQKLGYFYRPQATLIYIILIIFTFSFFIFNLWLFYRNNVGLKYLKISAIVNTLILIFAYPFLSSDLFNYLFDAKIILNYHLNPYTHKPLDFPGDEWLRFMRWTHRYSPYGPLWLGISFITALFGFGKFILNFLAFKIFIGLFHLINTYLIFKILHKTKPKSVLFGTAFYALNPLFLIEGVANAHNDIVLTAFILASIYSIIIGRNLLSFLLLLAASLVKYIPILNLPWLIWFSLNTLWMIPEESQKSKNSLIKNILNLTGMCNKNKIQTFIILNLLTLSVFTYLFSSFRITVPFVSSGATQVQFQPWYLFWTLPLIALLGRIDIVIIAITTTLGASLRYTPFLYYGDWGHSGTVLFMTLILWVPIFLASALISIHKFTNEKK